MSRTLGVRVGAALTAAVAVLALASCSSDSDDASTPTTEAETSSTSSTASSAAFDREVQQQLIDVGCYSGAADGEIGPETDQAIEAFQRAEGLEVDGEVGPETESALKKAADEGRTVCGTTSGTTVAPTPSTSPGTAVTPASAPCTATALLAALPSGSVLEAYTCAEGYAGGSYSNGQADVNFVLESVSGAWAEPGQSPCGTASAGIPPQVLQYCEAS